MLYITVCVLALLAATDVHGRYLYESTIHGSIETNKIVSNWEDALAQCKSEGGILAAPVTELLLHKMKNIISVNNHSTPYFINAKIVHSPKLQFMSSEGVSLDDMSVSDMIDELDPREGDCLAMDAHIIRVVSCSNPLPYMCYKESNTSTSTTEQTIEETTEQINICGTTDEEYKYVASLGSCYKYHVEEKNWDEASSVCESEGGYLTIVNNAGEANTLQEMFQPAKYFPAYIGLRDYDDNDIWTSVHGDSVDDLFNVWHIGRNPHTDLNCGTLDRYGKLDDFQCYIEWPFICEKEVDSSLLFEHF